MRAVKNAIDIPLVVNGDITSFEKATSALRMSGADAVMIGRGALGQPWLPGQIGRRLETGVVDLSESQTTAQMRARTTKIAVAPRAVRRELLLPVDQKFLPVCRGVIMVG